MTLKVQPLDWLLELEGTRGSAIPYLGYVEINLQIPGMRGYNEDILLLVIPATTYSKKVPAMVWYKIIDRVMGMIMKGKLARATMTWKQAHSGVVLSGLLQLPHKGAGGGGAAKGATPSTASNPTLPNGFCLDNIQGTSVPHRWSPFFHLRS